MCIRGWVARGRGFFTEIPGEDPEEQVIDDVPAGGRTSVDWGYCRLAKARNAQPRAFVYQPGARRAAKGPFCLRKASALSMSRLLARERPRGGV